jgi:Bacterial Ig domain
MTQRFAAGLIAVVLVLAPLAVPTVYGVVIVPAASDDFYSVNEDQELDVPILEGVLRNDSTPVGPCVVSTDVTGLRGHLPLDSLGFDGQFHFSPEPDFNGPTSFTYTLGTVGSTCETTGETATVNITVFEINDPPAIQLDEPCSNGITVDEDSGAFADADHCVEMVSFGPADESTQGFEEWVVTSTHPELFSAKPKISPVDDLFGSLTFTPAADAHGTSTVTIKGRDGASAFDGGDDLSEAVKFKITITAVDDPTAVPTDEPTPKPTAEQPTSQPTEAAPTIAPTLALTEAPTAAPSPGPESVPTDRGGVSVPILLGILLVVLVLGFGAALLVPKWRANRGG